MAEEMRLADEMGQGFARLEPLAIGELERNAVQDGDRRRHGLGEKQCGGDGHRREHTVIKDPGTETRWLLSWKKELVKITGMLCSLRRAGDVPQARNGKPANGTGISGGSWWHQPWPPSGAAFARGSPGRRTDLGRAGSDISSLVGNTALSPRHALTRDRCVI